MKATSKKMITSFSVSPQMQKQLKELRKENGISVSWLINKLLTDYFDKVGGKKNGEQ